VSLNRWVFKWRLKVRMFSHSRMSAVEFQVDVAATEKARRAREKAVVIHQILSKSDNIFIEMW